jgi:serine/threonine protein kinase
MKMCLKIVGGPDRGRLFQLEPGKLLVVGRGQQSDTRINDPSVSRIHFEITADDDSATIVDRGSTGGTYVDGKQVQTRRVQPGKIIKAGDSEFAIAIVSDDSEATIAPPAMENRTRVRPLAELVDSVFGDYELTQIIGQGTSGMVFKAVDLKKSRDVAVKVLTPQFTGDDEQRRRFVRAMKTMLPIRDDHVVRLYGAGKTGPYCWAAMEYIDGENLAQEIERIGIEGMMDWKKVWRVAVDIGQALKTGYEHKIVHRNLTPTNILRRRGDGSCVLGDFMLAKALEGTLAQQVTQPGQIMGSIPYIAPERTKADAPIDTRSDIYGLGATCYALLTGRPPISGSSLSEMIKNVRDEHPKPPKQYQLAINDLFQDVIMKMIAKSPDDRFDNPMQMLKELMKIGKFNKLDAGV